MLTAKYRLYFANDKDNIKEERLRPYDKAKHEIYKALKEEQFKALSWEELKDALSERDIDLKFKVSRTTREVQGVKFEYGAISFSGSKVGREFSYMNIDCQLRLNAFEDDSDKRQIAIQQSKEEPVQMVRASRSDDSFNNSLGLFSGIGAAFSATDAEDNQEIADMLRRKKKAKRKRGIRL